MEKNIFKKKQVKIWAILHTCPKNLSIRGSFCRRDFWPPLLPLQLNPSPQFLHTAVEFDTAHGGKFPDVTEHLVLPLTQ